MKPSDNSEYIIPTIEDKQIAQYNYCRLTGIQNFAGNGYCFSCGKNVYEKLTIEQCKNELITGCPFCNKSFCD